MSELSTTISRVYFLQDSILQCHTDLTNEADLTKRLALQDRLTLLQTSLTQVMEILHLLKQDSHIPGAPPAKKPRVIDVSSESEMSTQESSTESESESPANEELQPHQKPEQPTIPLPKGLRNTTTAHRVLSSTYPPQQPRPYTKLPVRDANENPLSVGEVVAFKSEIGFIEGLVCSIDPLQVKTIFPPPPPNNAAEKYLMNWKEFWTNLGDDVKSIDCLT
ncbi:hypothetical protein P9112_013858 [Eukaryota sp. TZLM1-RC]